MNIIDIQDNLKDFSEQQLIKEIQMPSGMAPQFLVLSEINRRKRMRDDYAKSQAANQMTVAEEAVAAGGVPQTGIRGMSEAMAPQSSMAQSGIGTVMNQAMKPSPMPQREMSEAEVMGMAEGGVLRYQEGGLPLGLRYNNPGNIRPGAGFYGETGEGDGYARFGSEEEGLRAMARLLGTYGDQYGINTVEDLVSRYAPRSDNPESFDNYVGYMSDALGVEPDEAFDLIGRRDEVIPAMIGFEQGREYSTRYSPELIDRAITAASYDDPEAIKTAMAGDVEPDRTALDRIIGGIQYGADELFGIGSAQAATQTPQAQPEDEEDSSFGARIRRAAEEGDEEELDRLMAQGLQEAREDEIRYKDLDPDDLGSVESQGMGIIDQPIGPGQLSPDQILQINPPVTPEIVEDVQGAEQAPDSTEEVQETGKSASEALADQLDFVLSQETTGIAKDISELQEELKAGRETDKWLALAQAGMALMSSREPTLMGALGEAGLAGLGAQREADQRYREGVIDLINARAKLAESPLAQSDAIEMYTEITNALNEKDELSGEFTISDPAERNRLEILRSRIAGSLPSGSTLSLLSME